MYTFRKALLLMVIALLTQAGCAADHCCWFGRFFGCCSPCCGDCQNCSQETAAPQSPQPEVIPAAPAPQKVVPGADAPQPPLPPPPTFEQ